MAHWTDDTYKVKARSIPQNQMTGECWMIQFQGKDACTKCQYHGKKECGGKKIIKTGKNEKGCSVPLGEEIK